MITTEEAKALLCELQHKEFFSLVCDILRSRYSKEVSVSIFVNYENQKIEYGFKCPPQEREYNIKTLDGKWS